jgi:hypothetical protein
VFSQFMQMKQMKMAQEMGLTAGPETEESDND